MNALAQSFYGIKDVRLIKTVGLDMDGADEDKILEEAVRGIEQNAF